MNTLCYRSLHIIFIKESISIFLTSILHKFSESNSLQYFSKNFVAKFSDIERRSHYVMMLWQQNFWMTTNRKCHSKTEFTLFQTLATLFSFIFIYLILANFSGVKSERTVSKFRKRKRKLLRSFKPEHEIRKFHVLVMQWWLRSVQKTVMYMQSYWIAYINLLLFFAVLVAVAVAVAIAVIVA